MASWAKAIQPPIEQPAAASLNGTVGSLSHMGHMGEAVAPREPGHISCGWPLRQVCTPLRMCSTGSPMRPTNMGPRRVPAYGGMTGEEGAIIAELATFLELQPTTQLGPAHQQQSHRQLVGDDPFLLEGDAHTWELSDWDWDASALLAAPRARQPSSPPPDLHCCQAFKKPRLPAEFMTLVPELFPDPAPAPDPAADILKPSLICCSMPHEGVQETPPGPASQPATAQPPGWSLPGAMAAPCSTAPCVPFPHATHLSPTPTPNTGQHSCSPSPSLGPSPNPGAHPSSQLSAPTLHWVEPPPGTVLPLIPPHSGVQPPAWQGAMPAVVAGGGAPPTPGNPLLSSPLLPSPLHQPGLQLPHMTHPPGAWPCSPMSLQQPDPSPGQHAAAQTSGAQQQWHQQRLQLPLPLQQQQQQHASNGGGQQQQQPPLPGALGSATCKALCCSPASSVLPASVTQTGGLCDVNHPAGGVLGRGPDTAASLAAAAAAAAAVAVMAARTASPPPTVTGVGIGAPGKTKAGSELQPASYTGSLADVITIPEFSAEAATKMVCQVAGCGRDLRGLKDYHQRYGICELHIKLPQVLKEGRLQRFCQQCGRFHDLAAFDVGRKSCREQLHKHNERRRRRTQVEAKKTRVMEQLEAVAASSAQPLAAPTLAAMTPQSSLLGPSDRCTTPGLDPCSPATALGAAAGIAAGVAGPAVGAMAGTPAVSVMGAGGEAADAMASLSAAVQAKGDVGRLLTQLMQNPVQLNALRLLLGVTTHPALPALQPYRAEAATPRVHAAVGQAGSRAGGEKGHTAAAGKAMAKGEVETNACYQLGGAPGSKQSGAAAGAVEGVGGCDGVGAHGGPPGVGGGLGSNGEGALSLPQSCGERASYDLAQQISSGQGPWSPGYESEHMALRISMKLFQRTPADLPPDLRPQLLAWLDAAPLALSGSIRPGCVALTLTLLLPAPSYHAAMHRGLASLLHHLLHATGCQFWHQGAYVVQLGPEMAMLANGRVKAYYKDEEGQEAVPGGEPWSAQEEGGERAHGQGQLPHRHVSGGQGRGWGGPGQRLGLRPGAAPSGQTRSSSAPPPESPAYPQLSCLAPTCLHLPASAPAPAPPFRRSRTASKAAAVGSLAAGPVKGKTGRGPVLVVWVRGRGLDQAGCEVLLRLPGQLLRLPLTWVAPDGCSAQCAIPLAERPGAGAGAAGALAEVEGGVVPQTAPGLQLPGSGVALAWLEVCRGSWLSQPLPLLLLDDPVLCAEVQAVTERGGKPGGGGGAAAAAGWGAGWGEGRGQSARLPGSMGGCGLVGAACHEVEKGGRGEEEEGEEEGGEEVVQRAISLQPGQGVRRVGVKEAGEGRWGQTWSWGAGEGGAGVCVAGLLQDLALVLPHTPQRGGQALPDESGLHAAVSRTAQRLLLLAADAGCPSLAAQLLPLALAPCPCAPAILAAVHTASGPSPSPSPSPLPANMTPLGHCLTLRTTGHTLDQHLRHTSEAGPGCLPVSGPGVGGVRSGGSSSSSSWSSGLVGGGPGRDMPLKGSGFRSIVGGAEADVSTGAEAGAGAGAGARLGTGAGVGWGGVEGMGASEGGAACAGKAVEAAGPATLVSAISAAGPAMAASGSMGLSLLHRAVRGGNLALLHGLLHWGQVVGYGWRADCDGPGGLTPLHLAALQPDPRLLLTLLPFAPSDAFTTLVAADGTTPFHLALQQGLFTVDRLLPLLATPRSYSSVTPSAKAGAPRGYLACLGQSGAVALPDVWSLHQGEKQRGEQGQEEEDVGGRPWEGYGLAPGGWGPGWAARLIPPCEQCSSCLPPLLLSIAAKCDECGITLPCTSSHYDPHSPQRGHQQGGGLQLCLPSSLPGGHLFLTQPDQPDQQQQQQQQQQEEGGSSRHKEGSTGVGCRGAVQPRMAGATADLNQGPSPSSPAGGWLPGAAGQEGEGGAAGQKGQSRSSWLARLGHDTLTCAGCVTQKLQGSQAGQAQPPGPAAGGAGPDSVLAAAAPQGHPPPAELTNPSAAGHSLLKAAATGEGGGGERPAASRVDADAGRVGRGGAKRTVSCLEQARTGAIDHAVIIGRSSSSDLRAAQLDPTKPAYTDRGGQARHWFHVIRNSMPGGVSEDCANNCVGCDIPELGAPPMTSSLASGSSLAAVEAAVACLDADDLATPADALASRAEKRAKGGEAQRSEWDAGLRSSGCAHLHGSIGSITAMCQACHCNRLVLV